jgi:hypothetical protein
MSRTRRWTGLLMATTLLAMAQIGPAGADPAPDAAGIDLSPSSADFGEVPLSSPYGGGPAYQPTTRTFTVTSTGTTDLVVGTPSLSGPNSSQFWISRNTCTAAVVAGGSCELDVTIVPFRFLGPVTATLVVPSDAPGDPRTALMTGTLVPVVAATTLTADPVSLGLGPLGGVRFFPRATLTDTATGSPLPLLGLGDTGREVEFTVNGRTVCTAIASPWNGVASCQGVVPLLAVLLSGGYDAHFRGFSHWGFTFLPSDAHGALIG